MPHVRHGWIGYRRHRGHDHFYFQEELPGVSIYKSEPDFLQALRIICLAVAIPILLGILGFFTARRLARLRPLAPKLAILWSIVAPEAENAPKVPGVKTLVSGKHIRRRMGRQYYLPRTHPPIDSSPKSRFYALHVVGLVQSLASSRVPALA